MISLCKRVEHVTSMQQNVVNWKFSTQSLFGNEQDKNKETKGII